MTAGGRLAMRPLVGNALWLGTCLPEAARFRRAAANASQTQADLLRATLRANADTEFGRCHNFAALRTVEDFQDAVPLATYDDYAPAVERIAAGEPGVLTAERVRLLEPSSGSTAATKLVPYTRRLNAEFQRGLAPWVADLYARRPGLLGGAGYWSISPLTEGPAVTAGGIPIGFDDDSAYLGRIGRLLTRGALAVPNAVRHARDMAAFRYVTLLCLLRRRDLRLISVWNPTFLSLLLAPLPAWWDRLMRDVRLGTLTPPAPLPPSADAALSAPPDSRRADELTALGPDALAALWPRLGLISCWADGPAARFARRLAEQFPGVPIQPKGLLATEAFVSLPLAEASGPVLALTSHFFEFRPDCDLDARPRLTHELEVGETYRVVVTTGGGFYRYQLHDLVEVTGHWRQAPCLRFVGKLDRLSDWFGEKLHEGFVAAVLSNLLPRAGLDPAFTLLAPEEQGASVRYVLYLDTDVPPVAAARLAAELDDALRRGFHYDYCRRLGQLGPAGICTVGPSAPQAYLRACLAAGQKLGNIKPAVLHSASGWRERFGVHEVVS